MVALRQERICVLCGGWSRERSVSLRSGKRVLNSLKKQGFHVISLDLEEDLVSKLKQKKIDLVFIMLHGKPGEDGTVQGMLEVAGIPYTGSKVLASALAMDKVAAKRIFDAVLIPTPRYQVIDPEGNLVDQAQKIIKLFPFPMVLKPTSEGSSIGVVLIKKGSELLPAIKKGVKHYRNVFIEEYISGKEVTVGILGKGKDTRALPILELVPRNDFYDYEAKYTSGKTDFILPARLPKLLYEKTQQIALDAHHALGCCGFSRVDIIVSHADRIPYVHEVNSIPGMTELSDLPAEAAHAGISFDELVVKILESAY